MQRLHRNKYEKYLIIICYAVPLFPYDLLIMSKYVNASLAEWIQWQLCAIEFDSVSQPHRWTGHRGCKTNIP